MHYNSCISTLTIIKFMTSSVNIDIRKLLSENASSLSAIKIHSLESKELLMKKIYETKI